MSAEAVPETSGPDVHTTAGKLALLHARTDAALHAGSERAVEAQHAKGKMTARERVEALLDEGSFVETDALARHRARDFGVDQNRPYGDGVITGFGTIDGRPVCVFSQDATVFGGSLGEVYGEKIVKVMDLALRNGCPRGGSQRRRRRPHPGGDHGSRALRRDLPAQRPRQRRRAAAVADPGGRAPAVPSTPPPSRTSR